MSLSFIKVPEYSLNLSNNVKVKYRPFLIKEEKVLLMAVESKDENEMNNALIKNPIFHKLKFTQDWIDTGIINRQNFMERGRNFLHNSVHCIKW